VSICEKDEVNRGQKHNREYWYVKHVQKAKPQYGDDETNGILTEG
jgi:hypothetical protein